MRSRPTAVLLGYDLAQVDQALEILITAGLLRRSPDSTDPARLYVLAQESRLGGWLSSLLQITATREGRLAVIKQRTIPSDPG
jgi:hypothetical protein